jgi:hypothetical protein
MKKFVIWDDFYDNPKQLRELILQSGFEDPNDSNYPGRNSKVINYPNEFNEFFSFLASEKLKPAENSHCGGFRIQNAGETGKQYIHVDLPSLKTTWAAICYLSLPEHYTKEDGTVYDSGTKFWKNKATGLEHLPYDIEYLKTIGLNTPDDLFHFMNTEGTDESKWIEMMSTPIKFNRLIMFRSNLWHSQAELFGDSMENGRLIQTFFFEPDLEPINEEGWKKSEN